MTDDPRNDHGRVPPDPRPDRPDRREREAAALRANLARRKAQRRGRTASQTTEPDGNTDDRADGEEA